MSTQNLDKKLAAKILELKFFKNIKICHWIVDKQQCKHNVLHICLVACKYKNMKNLNSNSYYYYCLKELELKKFNFKVSAHVFYLVVQVRPLFLFSFCVALKNEA